VRLAVRHVCVCVCVCLCINARACARCVDNALPEPVRDVVGPIHMSGWVGLGWVGSDRIGSGRVWSVKLGRDGHKHCLNLVDR